MRYGKTSLMFCSLATLASCALGDDTGSSGKADEPLSLSPATHIDDEGVLEYGVMVFDTNPTTLLEPGDFHGYEFHGRAGGIVNVSMTAKQCGQIDPVVHLFGPEDENGNRGAELAVNDDETRFNCSTDSMIENFTLPSDGEYLIVATTFQQRGGGHYALRLSCNNNACTPPGELTFQKSRIAQADIDRGQFTADQLFDVGDFLFEHVFSFDEGLGNNLVGGPAGPNARPNFRGVHQGGFGAPEAQSCLTCHNVGGDDGGGDFNHNIFQNGDGVQPSSGLVRNAPVVLGLGVREQLAAEMTAELQAQLAAGKQKARSLQIVVTVPLITKGVSFGSINVDPFGTMVFANLQGIDTDLVVKPFGWKGREATVRRFVEGGFRVHFGMQTSTSIAKHCATPDPNTFGNGSDCRVPDGDGVIDEITEGQLTAMATYMSLRQMPVRVAPASDLTRARVTEGERLFANAGCANCHTPHMELDSPVHTERADTTGGLITFDLTQDMKSPRPTRDANGVFKVELWTDFKRHDMGAELSDSKPFKNISASQFITPPLWGVVTSPPYMHDGRAATLRDAILAHGGEAASSRTAFTILSKDDQQKVFEFLSTLGREDSPTPLTPTTKTTW
jgi:hypothetical protein